MLDGEVMDDLRARIRAFAKRRNWEQFHTVKNLVMAVGGEAGELLAEVQWLTGGEIQDRLREGDLRDRLANEMADVLIYLVRLADVAEIDLLRAAYEKLSINEHRYPVEKSRGTAKKYTARLADESPTDTVP